MLAAAAPAGAATAHLEPGKAPFDIRTRQPDPAPVPETRAAINARESLGDRLGDQGVLDFAPETNTPRTIAKLDGFLTGPSSADPADIALAYVRANRVALGLDADDLSTFELVRRYADEGGTTHLVWAQVLDGITAWDNGLHANVTKDGRLINVSGSPVADLGTRTTSPDLTASEALTSALTDAGRAGVQLRGNNRGTDDSYTTFTGGNSARLVLFTEKPGDVHLAWNVTAAKDNDEVYEYVIDARSGQLLYRQNTVNFANANLSVWEYAPNIHNAYPGVPAQAGTKSVHPTLVGGAPIQVNDATALNGPYAHTYADVNDDNTPTAGAFPAGDEIPASTPGTNTWNYSFTVFNVGGACDTVFPQCSWNPVAANSWQANLPQNAAQVYYYVNNFHDWLAGNGIGFTAASGNFEAAGGDAVQAQVADGANTDSGFPDTDHIDNANMATPNDGTPPRMQMYLFGGDLNPGTSPYANGGDDASVIYHEYAHGLSNRLVTGGTGGSTLRSFHARAMGEGWSDFYAMDYLFASGLDPVDTIGTQGDVNVGIYMTGGDATTSLRSEPMDCNVGGNNSGDCQGGNTPHFGGYSLGDMGNILAQGAEFHADGEIWAQTLWQLRQTIGANKARQIITDGMRLSAPDPSFLDMRNAIIQADFVDNGGANATQIWAVFANRGMGVNAAVDNGADTTPIADSTAPGSNGITVSGRVTDDTTGAGVANAYVVFDAGGAPGDFATKADGNGNFSISGIQPATFSRAIVSAPGYAHRDVANVNVAGGSVNFAIPKNFAAAAGGARVAGFTGPDFTGDGCGPGGVIDGSLASGWGSTSHNNPAQGAGGSKSVVIELATATDVSSIAVDPTAVCGDGPSASTGQYTVEVSSNGSTFSPYASSTFGDGNLGKLNTVGAAASNVKFVRFTMATPLRQSGTPDPGGGFSGAQFMDASEIEVYGKPFVAKPPPPPPPPPVVDRVAPTARTTLVKRQKLKTALAKGLKFTVSCNEPCSFSMSATIDAKTAKKLKLLKKKSKAKTFKVGSGSLKLGTGNRTATVKFTKKSAGKLKRLKSFKLVVTFTAKDASGNARKSTQKVTLKK